MYHVNMTIYLFDYKSTMSINNVKDVSYKTHTKHLFTKEYITIIYIKEDYLYIHWWNINPNNNTLYNSEGTMSS